MSNFKTYVLDFALKQVNELTDVKAKYEQHKKDVQFPVFFQF